jgi:uncharacterized membrane protein (UPF0127 family)
MRLILMVLVLGCGPAPTPVSETAVASGPRVILPDGEVVRVEIAANDELRAQGLMYRDHLDSDRGMLFFFTAAGPHSFWMKNTRIPLDMIWLDGDRRIIHIERNVPPCRADPCPSYGPKAEAKAMYVLELAGGVADVRRLKTGDVLKFVELDSVVPR